MIETLAGGYRHKIKTVDELSRLIGPRPRARTVAMCHGVFDLVHPGHIRHLLYAKSKADVLVVSITSDAHITKTPYRPFVPQDLRAFNLAALEMVDYVIIDGHPTPLRTLAALQPDFFAKGYEYVDGGVHPKTKEEMEVVQGYGGDILFTPGDIVYSSSAIIETGPPDLSVEKLLTLMEAEDVSFDRLREAASKFEGVPVHVVGDTIVDSLSHTTLLGGMLKTPTSSVRLDNRIDYVGGAAIVALHLAAAGARVIFSTVLGEDPLADFVLAELRKHDVRCEPVTDRTRPTTHKNTFLCGDYRLLKVDTVDNRTISDRTLETIARQIEATDARAVVFSDFRHGIFSRRTIPDLIGAIPPGVFRVADSQVASRWGNILEFKGFDLITPNEREARFALADQDTGVRPLAARLHADAACRVLILKLGDRGVLTCRDSEPENLRSFFVIDSFAERVVDAVGAGDALLAYATLSMITDGSDVVASILGNFAAALECEVQGNVPIKPLDVGRKTEWMERRVRYERHGSEAASR
ncbi:MAG TPA: PfkB family carbohydrate kinase [bacterium]|nr:PfkB family carbohydrate kinase [bacterium]